MNGDEATSGDSDEVSSERDVTPSRSIPSLDYFRLVQRHVASVDFTAIRAAQRAIALAGGLNKIIEAQGAVARQVEQAADLRKIVETQAAFAGDFARSLDFSRLAETYRALVNPDALANIAGVRHQWASTLAKSIDLAALKGALGSAKELDALVHGTAAIGESLRQQTDVLAQLAQSVRVGLPTFEIAGLVEALDRWIPDNLRDVTALDLVATIALDEGLPLAWIPRTEIVGRLVDADGPEARLAILSACQREILDDCDEALSSINHEWATQCRSALAVLRAGHDGPAQSHASNIIDSIVLGLHGSSGRDLTKKRAQEDLDDVPLQLAAEQLALRPLFRAFAVWYPNSGTKPPGHFARHATSHAVGHPGVFGPTTALIAVMLATSLTVQYAP